jgi:elongation factor Ts
MEITAALVKELRERTGAGMMECKKALVEAQGDIEAAIEAMRKSGQAKAAKKAGRIAADGAVVIKVAPDGKRAVMVEVNSETDFVAKDANFAQFADAVGEAALACVVADVEALAAQPLRAGEATTIAEAREALIAKIGENIQIRRLVRFENVQGQLHSYRHGVRIGVLVEMEGGTPELGKDIAMHVAASNPCASAPSKSPPRPWKRRRRSSVSRHWKAASRRRWSTRSSADGCVSTWKR